MKFKSKFLTILFIFGLAGGITACTPPAASSSEDPASSEGGSNTDKSSGSETTKYSALFSNVELKQGETHSISYVISPVGVASVATYSISSANPVGAITIADKLITAVAPGVAVVVATITNVPNASKTFSFTESFNVTVTEPDSVDGQFIKNSGFENDFDNWTLTPANELNTFTNTIGGNVPHSGEHALNLWSKVGATEGEADPLDLTISQEINVTAAGSYLFSLWFKGDIETIEIALKSGDTLVNEGVFAGTGYSDLIAPEQKDYVHLGIGAPIAAPGKYLASIRFVASWSNNWGYADDVSFKLGSVEDLVRPEVLPIDEYNFVSNSSVGINLTGWTNVGADSINRGTNNGTYINCYGSAGGDFHFYQEIKNLPSRQYNALVKVIGSGDYTAETSECYFYIADASGEIIKKTDFVIPAYSWETVKIDDVTLSGTVRIGIKFVATTKVWAGVTGFNLYSEGYIAPPVLSSDTSLANVKVSEVDVVENAVELSEVKHDALVASKDNVLALVSGTVAESAAISAAVYNDTTNVLTITVTAEDGTTKNYLISVSVEGSNLEWQDITLLNPSFEDGYDAAGWTVENLKAAGNSGSGGKYDGGRGLMGYGNVLVPGTPARISQKVSGLEAGNKVKLSVWIATYYNAKGAKDDKCTSIKLLVGEQALEMDSVVADTSAFRQYMSEFTLSAADVVEGEVSVGLEFVMVEGGWVNIDLFALQALLPPSEGTEPVEPEPVDPPEPALGNKSFLNSDFEAGDKSGWTFENFKDTSFVAGGGKRNGSYGVMGYGNIAEPGTPAKITQNVEGIKVGDKVKVSVWISTYYNSNGVKDDKVTSIQLLAGAQAVEMDSVVAASSGWLEYAYEFTVTEADLVDGQINLGLSFTMVSGGWVNIDDFSLTITE